MKDLFLWTFNCGKQYVNENEVRDLVAAAFGNQDIAVFAFQEVCPIVDACLGNQHKYLDIIQSCLQDALGSGYTRVDTVIVGAIALIVYISGSEASHAVATVKNGMLLSSLKGAAAMRMTLSDSDKFTFVAAHLCAGEGQAKARNQDYLDLVTRLDFGDGYGAYQPGTQLFILGDLNYRSIANPFTAGGDNVELQDSQMQGLLDVTDGSNIVDELKLEMDNNNVFFGMSEAEIEFKPTYKFVVGSSEIYNSKRTPSWCDRVLFQSYHDNIDGNDLVVHAYKSLAATSSDHKPVYLSISVPDAPTDVIDSSGYLLNDTRLINLGLDPQRRVYAVYGDISDHAIGIAMYLATTKRGNMAALLVLMLTTTYYLFWT